jgi:hypothetical protein
MGEANSDVQVKPASTAVTSQEPEQSALKVEEMEDTVFSLVIAPPAGVTVSEKIQLEQVSAGDTVLSLRQLIAEYPSLACYTCYHLEFENQAEKVW